MKSRTMRTKQMLLRAAISSLYGKLPGCGGVGVNMSFVFNSRPNLCRASERPLRAAPHQLLQVILDGVGVDNDADGHQGVESKVKDLVAEKGDDPGSTQLKHTHTHTDSGLSSQRGRFLKDMMSGHVTSPCMLHMSPSHISGSWAERWRRRYTCLNKRERERGVG